MSTVRCAPPLRARVARRRWWLWPLVPVLIACMVAPAWAVPACTVASTATLAFGTVTALASTGDVTANTGATFFVNCTADVTTTPTLYSASTRTLVSGADSIVFSLSLVSPGGTELPTAPPGTTLRITKDGTHQTVPLFGRIRAANFSSLHPGSYTRAIMLTVEY